MCENTITPYGPESYGKPITSFPSFISKFLEGETKKFDDKDDGLEKESRDSEDSIKTSFNNSEVESLIVKKLDSLESTTARMHGELKILLSKMPMYHQVHDAMRINNVNIDGFMKEIEQHSAALDAQMEDLEFIFKSCKYTNTVSILSMVCVIVAYFLF